VSDIEDQDGWWCGGGVCACGGDRSLLLLLLACLFGCMSLSIHQMLLMNYGAVSMMVMVMSCAAVAVAVAGTVQTRRYSVETNFQGSYQTPDDARKLFIQDNIAYVVDGDGLNIINVSNSSSPSLMGSYETPSFARDVFVQDYIAYVADIYVYKDSVIDRCGQSLFPFTHELLQYS
jgi:hypothetical protein